MMDNKIPAGQETKEKSNAMKSTFIALFDIAAQKVYHYLKPNFNSHFMMERQTGTFVLETKIEHLQEGREYNIYTMATNDPTPTTAMEGVSLGYYRFRNGFNNCICIKKDPPTFEGWFRNMKREMLTPMREYVGE